MVLPFMVASVLAVGAQTPGVAPVHSWVSKRRREPR